MPELVKRSTFAELSDWSDHLDRLAERAERAAAAPAAAVTLAERASLATEALQLLWLALTPAVIAASCRASGLLGEPVLTGFLPLDQQLLAAHALRDDGLLEQQAQGQQREPQPEPAEVGHVEEEQPVDAGESVVEEEVEVLPARSPGSGKQVEPDAEEEPVDGEEEEELLEVDHQGEEQQEIELPPAADEWVTGPELVQLLGVSLGGIRCWNAKGWLIEGQHYRKDPSNRRRHLYNVEAVRAAVASKSRKLRGVEARTPEGIEERRQLRMKRQNLRRQAKRHTEPVGAAAEPERHTEPVGAPAEPVAGGRLEQLIEALLLEVRGSGS